MRRLGTERWRRIDNRSTKEPLAKARRRIEEEKTLKAPNPYLSPRIAPAIEPSNERVKPTVGVWLASGFVWIGFALVAVVPAIGIGIWLVQVLQSGGDGILFVNGREFQPLTAIVFVVVALFAAACQYWAVIHSDVLCAKIVSALLIGAALIGCWDLLPLERPNSAGSTNIEASTTAAVSTTMGPFNWLMLAWVISAALSGLVMARWASKMRVAHCERRRLALDLIRGPSDD